MKSDENGVEYVRVRQCWAKDGALLGVWVSGSEVVTEKPLHVRVAEALGCKPLVDVAGSEWLCVDGEHLLSTNEYVHLARYDTDWSATGPLIEKYGITLIANGESDWAAVTHFTLDMGGVDWQDEGEGPTPLAAVCNLILALAEAGRLEK